MTPGTVTASRDDAPHGAEAGHPQPSPSAGGLSFQGSASCWDAVHRLNDDGSASVTEAGLRYSRVALETEHRIAEFFTVP